MKNLLTGMLFIISGATQADIILESFHAEDSSYYSGGWILQGSDSYLGVRFTIETATELESITTNLGGSGQFFIGIVPLAHIDALPDLRPSFDPSELLFYTTNSFAGFESSDVRTYAGISLNPGDYAVIIGGLGDWGISDFGWMPNAPDLSMSQIPLSAYIEYRSHSDTGWVVFPESGIRVVLEGKTEKMIDSDGDGIADQNDNCILVANPEQRDTDADGYGNYCDPDFNQDLWINASDLAYMKQHFFTSDELADLNGDGRVNTIDLGIMKKMFFKQPGPSGLVKDDPVILN